MRANQLPGLGHRVLLASKSIRGSEEELEAYTGEEIYLPATMQQPFVASRGEKFAFFAIFSLPCVPFFLTAYCSTMETILWLPELSPRVLLHQGRLKRERSEGSLQ